MKKYIAIALLMVLGTAYPAYARWSVGTAGGGAAAAPACDSTSDEEIYSTPNTYTEDGAYNDTSWLAWTFTVGAGGTTVTGANIQINDYNQNASCTVEFYTNVSSAPGASLGASYTTATNSNLPNAMSNVEFLLSSAQSLAAGTYWVVFKITGAHQFGVQTGGSGTFKYSVNSGENWATTTDYRLDSSVLGCP